MVTLKAVALDLIVSANALSALVATVGSLQSGADFSDWAWRVSLAIFAVLVAMTAYIWRDQRDRVRELQAATKLQNDMIAGLDKKFSVMEVEVRAIDARTERMDDKMDEVLRPSGGRPGTRRRSEES